MSASDYRGKFGIKTFPAAILLTCGNSENCDKTQGPRNHQNAKLLDLLFTYTECNHTLKGIIKSKGPGSECQNG
jgi:hypothetical protein